MMSADYDFQNSLTDKRQAATLHARDKRARDSWVVFLSRRFLDSRRCPLFHPHARDDLV
jgi:hypothetical protein